MSADAQERREPFGGIFADPPLSSEKRERLRGGIFSPPAALKLLNSHYLIGKSEQDSGIFRIRDDGSLAFTTSEQFKLEVGNIFVQPSDGSNKPISAKLRTIVTP
jgi:hypothetical protein